MQRKKSIRILSVVLWIVSTGAIVGMCLVPGYIVGWDLRIYGRAIDFVRAGIDPYLAATSIQRDFYRHLTEHPGAPTPYSYVYSPITLPLLTLLGHFRQSLLSFFFWVLFILANLATILSEVSFLREGELEFFSVFASAVIFFPGLLQNATMFSGNIAAILYGLILLGCVLGWKNSRWRLFYCAVLLSCCFKPPFLSLLILPFCSSRKQTVPALLVLAAGISVFLLQPVFAPVLFRHFLDAVELQFSLNHDFSSSPAGVMANLFYSRVSYKLVSGVVQALVAGGVLVTLLRLRGKYSSGQRKPLQDWPLLMLGAFLLNPRLMEYDLVPLTLPLAILAWRATASVGKVWVRMTGLLVCFAVLNVLAYQSAELWKATEALILIVIFVVSAIESFRASRVEVGAGLVG